MVGFWFLEVTSLLYIVMTLNFFISGHMLPLDLLPEPGPASSSYQTMGMLCIPTSTIVLLSAVVRASSPSDPRVAMLRM